MSKPKREVRPPKDAAHAPVAQRFDALIKRLGMTQEGFAAATGGLIPRAKVSEAVTGQTKASSAKWSEAVARVAGSDMATAASFIAGRATLDELLAKSHAVVDASAHQQPQVISDDLSPNATIAADGYDWRGVPRDHYDYVHGALTKQHQREGIDPRPSWWTAEIERLLREAAGKFSKLPSRDTAIGEDEIKAEKQRRHEARAASAPMPTEFVPDEEPKSKLPDRGGRRK